MKGRDFARPRAWPSALALLLLPLLAAPLHAATPAPPTQLTLRFEPAAYRLAWLNPATHDDGSPLDDFGGLRLYRDDSLLVTLVRHAGAVGQADGWADQFPPPGPHRYALTALDRAVPPAESARSPEVATALGARALLDDAPLTLAARLDQPQAVRRLGSDGIEPLRFRFTHAADWLSVTPEIGTLPVGDSLALTIRADARFLSSGPWRDTLELACNDPERPLRRLPVLVEQEIPADPARARLVGPRLVIGGAPNSTAQAGLVIADDGPRELALRVGMAPAWLNHSTAIVAVPAGGEGRVNFSVITDPYPEGTVLRDSVGIRTNDPARPLLTVPVELRVGPARLHVGPAALSARQTVATAVVDTLRLVNDGAAPITVSLYAGNDWLALDVTSMVVTADVERRVLVTARLGTEPSGTHDGVVRLLFPGRELDPLEIPVHVELDLGHPRLRLDDERLEADVDPGGAAALPLRLHNDGERPLNVVVFPHAAWLVAIPVDKTTVEPGAQATRTLVARAERLAAGIYTDTLDISSNDPVTPLVRLPVRMRVGLRPLFAWSSTGLQGSGVQDGPAAQGTLTLRNRGGDTLVCDYAARAAWVTPRAGRSRVAAGQEAAVAFQLSPAGLAPGTYVDTLRITSSDPRTPLLIIPVSLAVRRPVPAALVLSDGQLRGAGMRFAPPDDITLRFGNSGEAALDFTLDHAPAWLRPSARSGRVVGNGVVGLTFAVDSTLAAGVYRDSLVILSTAPNRPRVTVPVRYYAMDEFLGLGTEPLVIRMPESGSPGRGTLRLRNDWERPVGLGSAEASLPQILVTPFDHWIGTGTVVTLSITVPAGLLPVGLHHAEIQFDAAVEAGLVIRRVVPLDILVLPNPPDPLHLALQPAGPNPARAGRGAAWLLTLPADAPTRVDLFDARGRLVRVLLAGRFPAGAMDLEWDGRDAAGRAAPAGLYFLRVVAGAERLEAKVALLH